MAQQPHTPVLIDAIIRNVRPVLGLWVDGTFGAGGYSARLLQEGADQVIALDRDAAVVSFAKAIERQYASRFTFVQTRFSQMADHIQNADGVVLDLGVSSMQLDQAERGFSFQKDGPLDMRMGQCPRSAAQIVNTATETQLADILYLYGEERASKRIAKAIVRERDAQPFASTLQLAKVIEGCLPPAKAGQSHPATRSFQALRIAVNEEYQELVQGLCAAERVLRSGGVLAVVSFHSIEDRIVKHFMQKRSGSVQGSRYAPAVQPKQGQFTLKIRKAIKATDAEITQNPRARSAKLRLAIRTDMPPLAHKDDTITIPSVSLRGAA